MASLPGTAHVIARGEPLPAFDCQAPLLSLPYAFRTEEATIPQSGAYLHADPRRTCQWEALLGERRRPRIGIAWAGNPEHRNDHNRSIDFSRLAPLFDLDVDWISLQSPCANATRRCSRLRRCCASTTNSATSRTRPR